MNDIYKKQVALLIRIMPSVYRIKDFAVHSRKGKGRESGRNQQPSANFEKLHRKIHTGHKSDPQA